MVAEDEINLAACGAEVGGEEFQAVRLQVGLGRALAELAAPEMLRLVGGGEGLDLLPKFLHGLHFRTNSFCSAFNGAKLRRWMAHGPNRASAARCPGVP